MDFTYTKTKKIGNIWGIAEVYEIIKKQNNGVQKNTVHSKQYTELMTFK